MNILGTVRAGRTGLHVASSLAGGVGGAALAYAVQAANVGALAHFLGMFGMGGIAVLGAPVLASAALGSLLVGGVVYGVSAASRVEGEAIAAADSEGFTDSQPS